MLISPIYKPGVGDGWIGRQTHGFHATTGKVPREMLREEKLQPLVRPYRITQQVERKVNSEGYVLIGGSRYSVPPNMVGRRVTVESGHGKVSVLLGDTIIAKHRKADRKRECVTDPVHAAEMWKLTLRGQKVPKAKPAKLLIQIPEQRPLTVYEEVIG